MIVLGLYLFSDLFSDVAAGNLFEDDQDKWSDDPYELVSEDKILRGRGTATKGMRKEEKETTNPEVKRVGTSRIIVMHCSSFASFRCQSLSSMCLGVRGLSMESVMGPLQEMTISFCTHS